MDPPPPKKKGQNVQPPNVRINILQICTATAPPSLELPNGCNGCRRGWGWGCRDRRSWGWGVREWREVECGYS